MSKQPRSQLLVAAKAALQNPLNYEAFLEKLSPKDRLNVTRHVEACEATGDPRHAQLWRRIAGGLMTLAPHFAKTDGQQRVRFFVPDGQYRMQVFAMEDLRDGVLSIYCGDALDEAIAAGVVAVQKTPMPVEPGQPTEYLLPESHESLAILRLSNDSHVPAMFYKDMMGWNRKALCIRVAAGASDSQADAVELLAALSLVRAGKPAAAAAATAPAPKSRRG
jgi:hypothetical protein